MRMDMGKASATDVPATAAEFRRQAKERAQKEAFQAQFNKLVGQLAMLPVVAYILMLAVGAAHGIAPAVPAIGYGTTFLLVLGADALSDVAKKFRK